MLGEKNFFGQLSRVFIHSEQFVSLSLPAATLARKRLLNEEKEGPSPWGRRKRGRAKTTLWMQVLKVTVETVTWFRVVFWLVESAALDLVSWQEAAIVARKKQ